jgi:hypothetical protein
MSTVVVLLQLSGYVFGALGSVCLFIEFFQTPSYVTYNRERERYGITYSPDDAEEYTWFGRAGALLLGLGFGLLFVATLAG